MTRIIDADALVEKIYEIDRKYGMGAFGDGLEMAKELVLNSPTIEPDRPHGEWIESKERKGHFYCSECVQEDPETGKWRETFDFRYPFCPNCGASMVKKEGDEK